MSPATLTTAEAGTAGAARLRRPAHRFAARQQEGKPMSQVMSQVMSGSMPTSLPRPVSASSRQQQERVQFRIILATTYPFFLAAALVQRVGTAGMERPAPLGRRRSVFGEAKAMAVSAIPFAFMG